MSAETRISFILDATMTESADIPFTTQTGILYISKEKTMPMEELTTLHEVKIQDTGSSGDRLC
jgi:hypothetical protein